MIRIIRTPHLITFGDEVFICDHMSRDARFFPLGRINTCEGFTECPWHLKHEWFQICDRVMDDTLEALLADELSHRSEKQ